MYPVALMAFFPDPAQGAPDIGSSAIELGATVAAQMTHAQIAEAQRLAREWEPTNQ